MATFLVSSIKKKYAKEGNTAGYYRHHSGSTEELWLPVPHQLPVSKDCRASETPAEMIHSTNSLCKGKQGYPGGKQMRTQYGGGAFLTLSEISIRDSTVKRQKVFTM